MVIYFIILRSAAWHYAACKILDKMSLLRVSNQIDMEGLDLAICGGHAFYYEPVRES
jgi:Amt family ammonium transporter